jgi:Fe-S cluster assembly protein SufD
MEYKESEGAIHGRKGAVDHGNYVEVPVASGPDVLSVPDCGHIHKVFIVSNDGEKLPTGITVGADAAADIIFIVLPGISRDVPLTIDIVGEGSTVHLAGIYLCSGNDQVTFDITMNHRIGHCNSRQIFNGIAAGSSKADFFGRIVVAPDAQKTEAYQENHNVVLSNEAKVNTKPRLEIYADDVKCSHGATVGKLDEEAQFYMQSRGIPEAEAKVLQMISFVAPVLEYAPEADRESLSERIENAIRQIVA